MTIDDIIEGVLTSEAGFANVTGDAGGPTNWGITARELGAVRALGREATLDEVKALSRNEAKMIYHDVYVVMPHFDTLPDPLRYVVVDWGVMSGPAQATHGLQTAIGAQSDGYLGPVTRARILQVGPTVSALLVCATANEFFGDLITHKPVNAKFASGWARRWARNLRMTFGWKG